ncbi:MAG: nucleoside phosphorylase [Kosmotoga sp.]|nr:MAG: nucleoside phosphorylase [Kosmotoga sp.]
MKLYHIDIEPGEISENVVLMESPQQCKMIADNLENPELLASKREYVAYNGEYKGKRMSITSVGLGGPAASIALEELISAGAKKLIYIGTIESVKENINCGELVIPTAAVRGDGTSLEYVLEEFPAISSRVMYEGLINASKNSNRKIHSGIACTHDALRLNSRLANTLSNGIWKETNVLGIEGVVSTLFVIAYLRGVKLGALLGVTASSHTEKTITEKQEIEALFKEMSEISFEALLYEGEEK